MSNNKVLLKSEYENKEATLKLDAYVKESSAEDVEER